MKKPDIKLSLALAVAMLSLPTSFASAKDLTIGLSVPSMGSVFWTSATYGVEEQAKTDGVTLIKLDAGSDTNVAQQVSQLGDLVQRRVDAIIVGATNGDAVAPIVERAIAAGIPVVGFSSPPSTKKNASYIGADHYEMGRLQAECLGKAIGGKGKVAMMSFVEGQVWAEYRANGFKETVAKEFPGIEIVAENRLAVTRAQSVTAMEDIVQRFPDIAGVYTTIDEMAAGAVTAIKSAGLDGRVKVSTSNLSPVSQEMLKKDEIVCTSVQKIVEQGQNALIEAVKAARGEPNTPAVILPAVMVSKENIGTIDFGPIMAPADYRP